MLLRISIVITVVAATFLLSTDVQCEFNQSESRWSLPDSVYEENKYPASHDYDRDINHTQTIDSERRNVKGIYDGWSVLSPQEFPYHAYIGCVGDPVNDVAITSWNCNGAIINDRFVITTATCIQNCTVIKIRVGATVHPSRNSSDAPQEYFNRIVPVPYHVHPQFTPGYDLNNLALIETADTITFSRSVGQVILPDTNEPVPALGEPIVATGFGEIHQYNFYWELQFLTLNVLTKPDCVHHFGSASHTGFCARPMEFNTIPRGRMCAEFGAPAVLKRDNRTLVGIYMRSLNCNDGLPEEFFKIQHYMSWIKEIAIDRLIT